MSTDIDHVQPRRCQAFELKFVDKPCDEPGRPRFCPLHWPIVCVWWELLWEPNDETP